MLEGTASDYRIPFYQALVRELAPRRVFLLAESASHEVQIAITDAGAVYRRLRSTRFKRKWRHPQGFSERNDLRLAWGALASLVRLRPHVVVSSDLGVRTIQAVIYGLLRPSARIVVWARLSEHSERGRATVQVRIRRALLRHVDAVIVNGDSGMRYIAGLGVSPERVQTVYQAPALEPASVADIAARRRNVGSTTLLYVGRLVEAKGIDRLLRVLANLNSPTQLRVVGEGPERSRLEGLSRELSLPVDFVGEIKADEALVTEYRRADFLVHPSLSDEWGLVIVEALAQGTPIIGSVYAQGVTQLVIEGMHGFTFQPDDAHALGLAITSAAATSDDEWSAMSAAAWSIGHTVTNEAMAAGFVGVLTD